MKTLIAWTVAAGLCIPALTGCRAERDEEPERMEERAERPVTYGGESIGEKVRGAEPGAREVAPGEATEQQTAESQETEQRTAESLEAEQRMAESQEAAPRSGEAQGSEPELSDLRYQMDHQHAQLRGQMSEEHEQIQTQMAGEHDLLNERISKLERKVDASQPEIAVWPGGRRIQAEAERRQWQDQRQARRDEMTQRFEALSQELEQVRERAEANGEPDPETRRALDEAHGSLEDMRRVIDEVRADARGSWDRVREPILKAESQVEQALQRVREVLREETPRTQPEQPPSDEQPAAPSPEDDQGTPLYAP